MGSTTASGILQPRGTLPKQALENHRGVLPHLYGLKWVVLYREGVGGRDSAGDIRVCVVYPLRRVQHARTFVRGINYRGLSVAYDDVGCKWCV
jgi:hypothetical protein